MLFIGFRDEVRNIGTQPGSPFLFVRLFRWQYVALLVGGEDWIAKSIKKFVRVLLMR